MAGLINLRLLTDFFNKIDQNETSTQIRLAVCSYYVARTKSASGFRHDNPVNLTRL